jgi:hypothetical protein
MSPSIQPTHLCENEIPLLEHTTTQGKQGKQGKYFFIYLTIMNHHEPY